ncbi:MAG: VCBS repeat-containing protein [Planctomycetes bacterium]|jgi:hypothetical protein|nr:VCBS repeat-containing protein [Planctomycetota bacterium]
MSWGHVSSALLLLWAGAAGAVEFQRQTISIPTDQPWWIAVHLLDVEADGRTDLLVLLPAQNKMQVYRQRNTGFAARPDQTVTLPERTAWIAMQDVDPHPGPELVISTPTGLVYLRQEDGAFEPSPQRLIEARQVFADDRLRVTPGVPRAKDADTALPVVTEDRAALYEKGADGAWHIARTVDLAPVETTWHVRTENGMMGPAPAFCLEVRQTIRARPSDRPDPEEDAKRDAARELIERITREAQWRHYVVRHQDVNGDGREDLVIWRTVGNISPTITILLLLRGPDGHLPARPTQVLRHSGLPIRVNHRQEVSPFCDLDGDGRGELVLVALKTQVTSWSGLVDMVVSVGVDWLLTVRSGTDRDYAGGPDFQMGVTSMILREDVGVSDLFLIDGDFNGDGHPDLLVTRGPEQLDVYLNSRGGGFFQTGPVLSFAAPIDAHRMVTADLNGDGICDLLTQKPMEAQVTIYLSQSAPQKGAPK